MSNVTRKLAGEVGRLLLAYVLIFSQGAWAAQDTKPTDTAKPAQKTAVAQTSSSVARAAKAQTEEAQSEASENATSAEKLPGDGRHEGIKVHGHWIIEVKNPDGTLAARREFENSLVPSGALSSILSRTYSVGFWYIQLAGLVPGAPCPSGECAIVEPGLVAGLPPASGTFNTLSVSTSGLNFVLNGTAVASASGNISSVSTANAGCPPTTPVSTACPNPSTVVLALTQATLSTPISVSAGQTIAVTVTISFS